MIEVVSRQRKVPVDCERWQAFVVKAIRALPAETAGVTVAFVSDRAMSELNRLWRHKRGTTDVLSFPAEQDEFEKVEGSSMGDVVISVEQAARQAKDNDLSSTRRLRSSFFMASFISAATIIPQTMARWTGLSCG